MSHYAEVIAELSEPTKSLREAVPEVFAGFGQLHNAAFAEGALSTKTKELIALSIAVVKECDGCIAYHAKAAARRGATPDEVAEALGVAVLMRAASSRSASTLATPRPSHVECRGAR